MDKKIGFTAWRITLFLILSVSLCSNVVADQDHQWIQPSDIKWIVVLGADTMWGGRNVWISADRELIIQNVRNMQEERYIGRIDKATFENLNRLIANHDFRQATSIPTKITDVTYVRICVGFANGSAASKGVSGSTDDTNFNQIMKAIFSVNETTTKSYAGEYDWQWIPPNFPKKIAAQCPAR